MRAHVDVDEVPLRAFGLADEHAPFDSDWHSHRVHQLLYASAGTMRLITDGGTWLLPPLRAAWIPARTRHRVHSTGPLSLRTVYFAEDTSLAPKVEGCAVFNVDPLAREMIAAAMRWGPDAKPLPLSEHFFAALAALCSEWITSELPLQLPAPQTPELSAAVDFVLANLAQPLTLNRVARQAGLSVRTLERRFVEELGLSFRDYLRRARMVKALEALARPGARVKAVAQSVGFQSEAAFTRAFVAVIGERPTDYQKKVRGGR